MGSSPWGHKKSDMTERLSLHTCISYGWCVDLRVTYSAHSLTLKESCLLLKAPLALFPPSLL